MTAKRGRVGSGGMEQRRKKDSWTTVWELWQGGAIRGLSGNKNKIKIILKKECCYN